ncbi:hypothetical protein WH47_03085 [Habropoda laboriosa]|uniref:Uncharacterized protein n=1 Tax=Habropoda laboriosa TaxID=597456 RepID=A0A0L7QY99_9HYME|nr:hypothetical protein WH47_03085 [Habropoda laboriosa]
MEDMENKEIEGEAPGTPRKEKRKRGKPSKEGYRSRERSSNRTMMEQWSGFTGKEDKAEEIDIEESPQKEQIRRQPSKEREEAKEGKKRSCQKKL